MPTPGSSSCAAPIELAHVVDRDRPPAPPSPGSHVPAARRCPSPSSAARGRVGDLAPAPGRSRSRAGRSSAGSPPAGGRARRAPRPAPPARGRRSAGSSPIPTRIPLVNGIRSSPAQRIVSRRARGCLRRRALVGDEVVAHRLEHQPLRRGDLAQPREVLARQDAEVGVRQQPALQRPLAGPHDVGGEVRVAVGAPAARATSGLTSGRSPVSTSSSLTLRRAAPSSSATTSSGVCRCAWWVLNAQYLQ